MTSQAKYRQNRLRAIVKVHIDNTEYPSKRLVSQLLQHVELTEDQLVDVLTGDNLLFTAYIARTIEVALGIKFEMLEGFSAEYPLHGA